MAIFRKNTPKSNTVVPKKQIIKVNPYENPESVLELMASICSATPSADTDLFWNTVYDAFDKEVRGKSLYNYITENKDSLLNKEFKRDLYDRCWDVALNLSTHENTEHTQIVVAGGFSSGKSSFLNRLTNSANLLPTGVEPVSVVKTYLYCSNNTKSVAVKGVNQKNVLVTLEPNVLQAIQHAKKSNIYLASVLDKLFVEIPSNELDGLVFIDTPGYNNSDKANQSNGKTDRETALEALGEGNVLFWLVDSERGTTVSDDIEIIKQFDGKKVFIFNKADKKGEKESAKIVEDAARVLYKEFPQEEIIDIIAFSTLDNRIYYSKNKKTLNDIINDVKKSGNGTSKMASLIDDIKNLFEDEIIASKNAIKNIEDGYKEDVEWKDKAYEYWQNAKSYHADMTNALPDVIIQSYNDIMNAADNITNSSRYAIDSFLKFYNGVMNFENNDHWGTSSILNAAINQASKAYDNACDKHNNAIKYTYYQEDYREELVRRVKAGAEIIVERFKEHYDEACETCDNAKNNKVAEENIIKDISDYKNIFMSAVKFGIKQYQQKNKAAFIQKEATEIPNVFECIKQDNYKLFLRSFEDGVDLAICNTDGYNPLTLAVQVGNNTMVQFLLSHDVDPAIKDKRGYNAFHTAVENQYRDICKMLLDYDPDLIDTKTSSGESVEDLARKQTFIKWIEKEII